MTSQDSSTPYFGHRGHGLLRPPWALLPGQLPEHTGDVVPVAIWEVGLYGFRILRPSPSSHGLHGGS